MILQLCVYSDACETDQWMPCDSDEALWYLTPVVGPTSTIVLHHVSRWLTSSAGLPCAFGINALSAMFGVAPKQLLLTFDRLQRFGLAERVDTSPGHQVWRFRLRMPPMSRRFARRLPDSFLQDCPYLNFDPTIEEMSHDQG